MELAHTHTWKLFLLTVNLLCGFLAPPSALHARALTLVGVMPADREGWGRQGWAGAVVRGCLLWPQMGGMKS